MNTAVHCITKRQEVLFTIAKRFRKPPWVPPSPSKIFRVPKPRPMEPQMNAELIDRFAKYNTQMATICEAMKANVKQSVESTKATDTRKERDAVDAEIARNKERVAINEQWNEAIAKARLAWMKEAETEERQKRLKTRLDKESQQNVDQQFVDEFVLKLQEETQDIITRDNIEQAIEAALDNVVDYNFAIDANGNMYKHGEMVSNFLLSQQKQKPEQNQKQ